MRRAAFLVGAWLLAGMAAVAAATVAVSLVGRQVTGSRPAPLSAEEVAQELAARPPTSTTSGSAPTTAPAGSAATTETTLGGTSPTAPTATTAPPPPVATTAAPPAVTETRTYTLVGGTATISFSTAGAKVVTATPKAGFEVDVEPEHGNGVKVEFESEAHKSRVSAWWEGGPREDVREEADDD